MVNSQWSLSYPHTFSHLQPNSYSQSLFILNVHFCQLGYKIVTQVSSQISRRSAKENVNKCASRKILFAKFSPCFEFLPFPFQFFLSLRLKMSIKTGGWETHLADSIEWSCRVFYQTSELKIHFQLNFHCSLFCSRTLYYQW